MRKRIKANIKCISGMVAVDITIHKKRGYILSFNKNTLHGIVVCGKKRYKFPSTCFRNKGKSRWPEVGEQVEIILTLPNELVIVRALKD